MSVSAVSAGSGNFPAVIELPAGFQPEGIAVGKGATFYTGSLVDGAVYRGDLRTGAVSQLAAGQPGMTSVGMAFDERSGALFVAGGSTGLARVFDGESGELLASYQLATPPNFINDVIVTRQAAYFTNSNQALLYRLPLGPAGQLPEAAQVQTLTLSGDWQTTAGFNANGIEASPDGKTLIVVHTTAGVLYRVDAATGVAKAIDLGGQSVSMGDGLLLDGSLLYVVRNGINQIVSIKLAPDWLSGAVVATHTQANFDVPTTLAAFGDRIYAVNARFGALSPESIPYQVLLVEE
jgi:sugar lactone lactonase YvrE